MIIVRRSRYMLSTSFRIPRLCLRRALDSTVGIPQIAHLLTSPIRRALRTDASSGKERPVGHGFLRPTASAGFGRVWGRLSALGQYGSHSSNFISAHRRL